MNRIKKLGASVKLHVATDDGSVGKKGYNTLILEELIANKKGKKIGCVYACGPEPMMKKVSDICFASKVNAQISVERYMKCGFGVCGQCSVDPKGFRTCVEGPCVSNEVARSVVEFGKYHRDKTGKMHKF